MRRFLIAAVLVSGLGAASAWAQDATADIRAVISDQIAAFRVDDVATAFGFASPSIRQMFGSPENFGQMVRSGYPMVWRPADVRFSALVERDGRKVQSVMVTDRAGSPAHPRLRDDRGRRRLADQRRPAAQAGRRRRLIPTARRGDSSLRHRPARPARYLAGRSGLPASAVDEAGRGRPSRGRPRFRGHPGRPRPAWRDPVQVAPPSPCGFRLRATARPKRCFGFAGRDSRAGDPLRADERFSGRVNLCVQSEGP